MKILRAQISELTLENNFLEGALIKAGLLSVDFCIEAIEEALARYGKPDIFNTDQSSQFTSISFTEALKDAEISISMPLDDCLQSPAGYRWQGSLAGWCLRRKAVANNHI